MSIWTLVFLLLGGSLTGVALASALAPHPMLLRRTTWFATFLVLFAGTVHLAPA